MWYLKKNGANEHIYKTERVTNVENRLLVAKEGGEGWTGNLGGLQMQTITYKVDKQQGPTVQHRELYLMSCDSL